MILYFGQKYTNDFNEETLKKDLLSALSQNLDLEVLFRALGKLQSVLTLKNDSNYNDIINFINPSNLRLKISRELGETKLYKVKSEKGILAGYSPLGVVTHIMPANAPMVSFLAVIESLLVGNINIVKESSRNDSLVFSLFEKLLELDDTNTLSTFIHIFCIGSKDSIIKKVL